MSQHTVQKHLWRRLNSYVVFLPSLLLSMLWRHDASADAITITPGDTFAGYYPLENIPIAPQTIADGQQLTYRVAAAEEGDVFNFQYAGVSYDGQMDVTVSSEGYIIISPAGSGSTINGGTASSANLQLPSTSAPANIIAPSWTDLDISKGGQLRVATVANSAQAPGERTLWFVAQWSDVPNASDNSIKNSFQVWLKLADPSNSTDSFVQFTYKSDEDMGSGNNGLVTVGAQNGTKTVGNTYRYNSTGPAIGGDNLVVRYLSGNQTPELAEIDDKTVYEGSPLTFTASATDIDTPAQTLTYSLEDGAPDGASINSSTGEFTWTPTPDQGPNTYPITVKVTDNGTPPKNDTEAFTVTVKENHKPVLDAIGSKTALEEYQLSFDADASDSDDDTLEYSLAAGTDPVPAGASIDPSTGVFTWTPTTAQSGTYKFKVVVEDNSTPNLSAEEEITVTVEENHAPVITPPGAKSVSEGKNISFTVEASDEDEDFGQTLEFSLVGENYGATIDYSSGEFSWTPPLGTSPGSYTFTVKVTDGKGGEDTEVITVKILAIPVLLTIGNRAVNELSNLSFKILGTDSDNAPSTLVYSATGLPAGASFKPATRTFSWTPTEAQGPGNYEVKFTVSDGTNSDEETINIQVHEVNTPPVITVGSARTFQAGTWNYFTVTATDADQPKNSLQFSVPGNSSASLPQAYANAATGQISVNGPAALSQYNFTLPISVQDGYGAKDTKNVVLTFTPPPVVWLVTPTFSASEVTLVYQLKNNSTAAFNGISTQGTAFSSVNSITKSVGTVTQQVQGSNTTGIVWKGFSLSPGQLATLTVKVKRPTGSNKLVAGGFYMAFSTTGNGTAPPASNTVSTP